MAFFLTTNSSPTQMKKAASMPSDEAFDSLTPRVQLVVLEDERTVASQDLAFAVKAYEKLLKDRENLQTISEKAAESMAEIKETFLKMQEAMLKKISPLLSFDEFLAEYDRSDELLDNAIDQLIQPLVQALEPFMSLEGMPDVPFLDSLKDIMATLRDMGRIQKETKKYLKKNGKNSKPAEPEGKNDEKDEGFINKIKNSKIGKLGETVVKLLILLAHQLVMFILFFLYNVVAELIDLLKPVFETFGIVAGTFIGLLIKFKDVLSSANNIGGILLLLLKLIWERIQETFNIFYLFGSGTTEDEQLIAMRHMIAENKVRLEYCAVNTDASVAQMQLDECSRWRYDKREGIGKIREAAANRAVRTKEDAENFKLGIGSKIEKYEIDLAQAAAAVP